MSVTRRNGHRNGGILDWLGLMIFYWSEVSIVFSSRTTVTKFEPSGETLEANECCLPLLAVLTKDLLWRGDGMHQGRGRGSRLNVAHDGDVGYMGIVTDQGALWTSEGFILYVTRFETLAAESMTTAHQQTRLLFATGCVRYLTHGALEHVH